jgi:glutamate 5-kinase
MSTKIVAARLATSAGVTTVIARSSNPGNISNIVHHVQSLKLATTTPKSYSGTPVQPDQSQLPSQSQSKVQSQSVIEDKLSETLTCPTASTLVEPHFMKASRHTRFLPSNPPIRDRYFWLLHGLAPHGTVYIDSGAQRALANKSGLLPVGIIDVEGSFAQQEAVRLVVVNRIPHSPMSGSRSPAPSNGNGSENGGSKLWDGTPVEVGRALVNYSAMEIARIKGCQSTEIAGILGYADSEYVALRENISFFKRESRPVTPSLET